MTLAARLSAIVNAMPDSGAVTLPVAELRQWLAEYEPAASAAMPEPAEEWLTAEQCAERLSVSVRWCYDHAKDLGAKKLSRRCVRFSSRAVARYLARRG